MPNPNSMRAAPSWIVSDPFVADSLRRRSPQNGDVIGPELS